MMGHSLVLVAGKKSLQCCAEKYVDKLCMHAVGECTVSACAQLHTCGTLDGRSGDIWT